MKGIERSSASEASSESNGNARRALPTRIGDDGERRAMMMKNEDARSGVGCRFS